MPKAEVKKDIQPYWTFHDDLPVMDGIALKYKRTVIPTSFHHKTLDQLHSNLMGIEKTQILAHESIYWINIYDNIERAIKSYSMSLEFQHTQQEKNFAHKVPGKPCETIGADILTLNNTNYLYIVDYHGTFPIVKRTEGLSGDDMIKTCKIIFVEYGRPTKIMSDARTNFISEKFQ